MQQQQNNVKKENQFEGNEKNSFQDESPSKIKKKTTITAYNEFQ